MDSENKIHLNVALASGDWLLIDNCEQLLFLCEQFVPLQLTSKNSAVLRAIKTAIVLLLFNLLEGYSNFLASIAVATSKGQIYNTPQIIDKLSIIEIAALEEKALKFDSQKCMTKEKEKSYLPVLDKLIVAPYLLCKLFENPQKIDKGCDEWRYIESLKKLRDELTHLKHNLSELPDKKSIGAMTTSDSVRTAFSKAVATSIDDTSIIINGFIGTEWYIKEQYVMLHRLFKTNSYQQAFILGSAGIFSKISNIFKN